MRLAWLCVLACSGCFDFSRVERPGDLGASDGFIDLAQPDGALEVPADAGDDGFAVSCPSIVHASFTAPLSGNLGEYVSVVAQADKTDEAYVATDTGRIVRLMTAAAAQVADASAYTNSAYPHVASIADDPLTPGSVVIAANSSSSLLPLLMTETGGLGQTKPSTGTSTDIAATSDRIAVVSAAPNMSYSLVLYDRDPTSAIAHVSTIDTASSPRVLAKGGHVIVCASSGLFEVDQDTGMLSQFGTGISGANRACTSLAAATLSTGATRWAYTSSAGFVCVSDDVTTPWRCTEPKNSPMSAVAIAPCDPHVLIAMSQSDIFLSSDDGATWTEESTGLPPTTLLGVTITNGGVAFFIAQGGMHFTWH